MKNEGNDKRKAFAMNNKNRVVGWSMTAVETQAFFNKLGKEVLTFLGYSSAYEDDVSMLKIVETILAKFSPETAIINIGATSCGIGAAYPVAKSMGFTTTGIVSSLAIECIDDISPAVDHICFVDDDRWGGKMPGSEDLSQTSQAMVACSDIMIGIGGGEISCDEMLAGKEQGKPVYFYPAEINHDYLIQRAQKKGLPAPDSFWGAAHEKMIKHHRQ